MSKFNFNKLPQIIKARIIKTKEGNYIAELPEYGNVFTQAESREQLDFNFNDLILAYFDVPKDYHRYIWYKPEKEIKSGVGTINIPLNFEILLSKNFFSKWQ